MFVKVNYFEFFQIPVSFFLDLSLLKEKYFQNSRNFHPDYHATADEETKQNMLEQSTLNNEAFKTLNDEHLRVRYILGLYNLNSDGEKQNLPSDFLMEMMELNEAIAETDGDEESLEEISSRLSGLEVELNSQLNSAMKKFDEASNDAGKKELLIEVQQAYLKFKYLLRIRESLNKFAD